MTLRRRMAVGGILLVSGAALGLNLKSHGVDAPPPLPVREWDWRGLEEDLDLLETLSPTSPDGWRERSDDYAEELAAVDALPRAELGRHLPEIGRLLAAAGLAAERSGDAVWPRFGRVEGEQVNVPWYRAARLLEAHPELAPLTTEPGSEAAIEGYVRAMASGALARTDRISLPEPIVGATGTAN